MGFDLRSALTRARMFFAAIAPVTPIKLDDELPALIDAFLEDALLFGWLEEQHLELRRGRLSLPFHAKSLPETPPVAIQGALQRRQIDWSKVPGLIEAILGIVSAVSHFA